MLVVFLLLTYTFALNPDIKNDTIVSNILRVDESAYGDLVFNNSNLDFKPIMDNDIESNSVNVVHISFNVGGA